MGGPKRRRIAVFPPSSGMVTFSIQGPS
jgi:hypothetical protein